MQYHCMFVQKKLRKIYEQMYDEYAMRGNDRKITRIYDLTSEHGYFATIFTQMGFPVSIDRNFSSEIEKIYTKMGMKVSNGVCSKKKHLDNKAVGIGTRLRSEDQKNENVRFGIRI